MRSAVLLSLCLVSLAGCKKPPAVPVPVKGKVVFADGKPVQGMVLSFHPDDEATKFARLPVFVLPDDGSFSGECLAGRYKVTLGVIPKRAGEADPATGPVAPPPPGAPTASTERNALLLKQHADPAKTPLTVDVPDGGTSDLVLTVK